MRTPGPPTTSSSSSTPGPTILSPPPSSGNWLTLSLGCLISIVYDALLGVYIGRADAVPDDDTDADVQDC